MWLHIYGYMTKFKLVFDIGGNIGKSSDYFKNISEKVICFEPNEAMITRLTGKFRNSNVIVDGRGVSNVNGKQTFHISPVSALSTFSQEWITASRFSNGFEWRNAVEVETVKLDDLIDQYGIPDYVKIDVEGHEYEVLTSFTKLLSKTLFAFEWVEEQKQKMKKILQHVHQLGYNRIGFTDGDEILLDESIKWKSFEDFTLMDELDETRKTRWGMIYFKNVQ